MNLLLDTHVFLWSLTGSSSLRKAARDTITGADAVYISAASIWEIAIKTRLGKMEGDAEQLATAIDASGFIELPVTAHHAAAVGKLLPHHTDPFDRLLIAQSLAEPLHFLTADRALAAYGGNVIVI
jgi:PIN domain nuclease of toxin-antitoxin system